MAVIQNISTEIGDVLRIKTDVPFIGILALSSFVDQTVGETGTRYFEKTFRYSLDGVNFSDYLTLTNDNLSGIDISVSDTLILEYLYKRVGSDGSGNLQWDSTELQGTFEAATTGAFYSDSMFATYLGDVNNTCSLAWSINVLEKLYKKGIIPNFIERGQSQSNIEDRDFIDFWRSITHYFALFVCLARHFKVFYINPTLLLEYLKQRGLIFCSENLYEDLYYAMSNFYSEVHKRGTLQVFKEKNSTLDQASSSGSRSISISTYLTSLPQEIDGEYLRMLCYDSADEFILNFNRNEHIGWNIRNSSPGYKGMTERLDANKFYVENIKHISDSVLFNPQYCSSDIDLTLNARVLKITGVPNGSKSGIGIYDAGNLIKVNPNIDYEFTFFINRYDLLDNDILTFGCYAYDKDNNLVGLKQFGTTADSTFFTEKTYLKKESSYYFARGIIFRQNKYTTYNLTQSYVQKDLVKEGLVYYVALRSVDQSETSYPPNSNPTLWRPLTADEMNVILLNNLGGDNLVFTSTVTKILPFIYLDCTGSGDVGNEFLIHTVRLNPLSTPYSKGFIQSSNFIDIWNTNRNDSLSEAQIKEKARKYLLPYKSFNKINFITKALI